jgi:aminopeptidase N
MNKHITSLFLLVAVLLSACQPIRSKTGHVRSPFDFAWEERSIFEAGLVQSARAGLSLLPKANVYHITIDIAEDMTHLNGIEEVHYTNRSKADLAEVQLRLYPNLLGGCTRVSSVQVDGQALEPRYSLADSLMAVPLPAPLQPGNSVTIRLEFSVTVPTEMETNYGILVYHTRTLALAHFYPMLAVYEDGWQAEIPPQQGDIIFSEPGFYIVSVEAPAEQVIVSSGREVERLAKDGRQQVLLAAGPARDFYLAASPDYRKTSETAGGITINSFASSANKDGAQLALQAAKGAIQEFSRDFAPYPYTEFDLVTIPTLAYGIEYPGMTAINQDLYDLSASSKGTPMSILLESTAVHELAHQWFYNLVGNDPIHEPWLDESLAQYITWQYYRDRYGESAAQGFEDSLQARWNRVKGADIPIGLPVKGYQENEYSAIVYGRGAFFFEAVEAQMGPAVFDRFLQEYTEAFSWETATADGFKQLAEHACSCDLLPLFNEWVYPAGE